MNRSEREKYESFLVQRIEELQRAAQPYVDELARLRGSQPSPVFIVDLKTGLRPNITLEELRAKLATPYIPPPAINREDL